MFARSPICKLEFYFRLIAIVLVANISGCTPAAREIGAAATPVVVRSGLHEFNAPDDQQQLERLVNSTAFRHATRTVGEGVGVGLFNEANNLAKGDDGQNNIASRPAGTPTSRTGATLSTSVAGGGLNGFVKSSVQEAILAATDPRFKAGEEAMSQTVGEGLVSGMIKVLNENGPQLGETIRRQLGPIVQELIRDQISPAVRDMLEQQLAPVALQVWKEGATETLKLIVRPDLQPDVQENAQNMSIGAAHGTRDVFEENGVLSSTGKLSPHLKIYASLIAGFFGVVLGALLILLITLNVIALGLWRRQRKSTG